jgi:hypothetical protein
MGSKNSMTRYLFGAGGALTVGDGWRSPTRMMSSVSSAIAAF